MLPPSRCSSSSCKRRVISLPIQSSHTSSLHLPVDRPSPHPSPVLPSPLMSTTVISSSHVLHSFHFPVLFCPPFTLHHSVLPYLSLLSRPFFPSPSCVLSSPRPYFVLHPLLSSVLHGLYPSVFRLYRLPISLSSYLSPPPALLLHHPAHWLTFQLDFHL